jgi:hypothetical protein
VNVVKNLLQNEVFQLRRSKKRRATDDIADVEVKREEDGDEGMVRVQPNPPKRRTLRSNAGRRADG